MTEQAALLEREEEWRVVDELLAAASAAGSHMLLVEGHAGIGKSALLDAAVARARSGGGTGLRAPASALAADVAVRRALPRGGGAAALRGGAPELESASAFGVALQLFEPLLAGADDETHDRLLAGAAALAGPPPGRPASRAGGGGGSASSP